VWRIIVVLDDGPRRLHRSYVPYVPCLIISTIETNERPSEERIIEIGSERVVAEVEEQVGSVVLHPDVESSGDPRSTGLQRERWHGQSEWIVAAGPRAGICGWTLIRCGGGQRLHVGVLVVDRAECFC
jgi:hypothetical protein